jgi:hypothetical protein
MPVSIIFVRVKSLYPRPQTGAFMLYTTRTKVNISRETLPLISSFAHSPHLNETFREANAGGDGDGVHDDLDHLVQPRPGPVQPEPSYSGLFW